jgi:type II secretory ATPase GspE/PulE/Tfp pilus assembly ATPase PilB-like protein
LFEKHGFNNVTKVKRAVGCEFCNNKGYKGRAAIFEILDVNDNIVRMVSNNAMEYELLEQAQRDGTKTLLEAGLQKVVEGVTTLDEVMRISLG